MMFRFLVTGANFINKGAQSMLFVTVSQLRKRYPDCEIYMLSAFDYNENQPYTFQIVHQDEDVHRIVDYPLLGQGYVLWKDFVKLMLGREAGFKKKKVLYNIFPLISVVIDISGYALSSSWGEDISRKYIRIISEAKERNIPVVLMPQSFGPFDYKNSRKIDRLIKTNLCYPYAIYARERQGKEDLESRYGLKNVHLSPDLVLCNEEPDIETLYYNKEAAPPLERFENNRNTVAIVPNIRTIHLNNREELLLCYREIIKQLLKNGREVVLIRHSKEDLELCKDIKDMYSDEHSVSFIQNDLDCFSYVEVIRTLDFVIGSRYHALVHALKEGIPCIALGWAEKYKELFELFDFQKYVFNVHKKTEINEILNAVDELCKDYDSLKKKIQNRIQELQCYSCFDILKDILT